MNKHPKVLVVEDDHLFLRIFQEKFSRDGFQVATALDGQEGLEKIEKEKPDLVLLDIMMPRMDGVEMLEKVKTNPKTRDIPVIMLTNLGEEGVGKKCLDLGAAAFWIKSNHRLNEIVTKVKEVLDKPQKQKKHKLDL